MQGFFYSTLARYANGTETSYWNDILRAALAHGQGSPVLAARELGKTMFDSAEYAARGRDNHWYVYDLYKAYLLREPDAGGWAWWEDLVNDPDIGREPVRREFEADTSPEFIAAVGSIYSTGAPSSAVSSLVTARTDGVNQPRAGLLARAAEWSVPILSLPGRAGLDLGLELSYSSAAAFTRSGPYIYFDEDYGTPSPGFRLGFPTVQELYFDAQVGVNVYLLITPAGNRVALRQVGATNIYKAADSSYLQLTDNGGSLLVRSTDGTQLSYAKFNSEWRCTQIKDRNGNYITVNYDGLGEITTIIDTLERTITFNYDGNDNLISIRQSWNGQTHQWATFSWTSKNMQSNFPNLSVVGAPNGTLIPALDRVGLADGSVHIFGTGNSVMVNYFRHNGAYNVQLSSKLYFVAGNDDWPRAYASNVWARNWTGINGLPYSLTTQYSVDPDGAHVLTAPDGTVYKEYYGTLWQRGLVTASEVWSGGVKQKWTTIAWTQDNTSVNYQLNPRVTETNVHDALGNRRRKVIEYNHYAAYGLPHIIRDYAAIGEAQIKHTFIDYDLSQAYLDHYIIGLVSELHTSDTVNWETKTTYSYDEPAQMEALPAPAPQHDPSLTTRGNVTSISRWDATDKDNPAKILATGVKYNTTGAVIRSTDPAGHQQNISYADSFSDGNNNRNTFAYPTTATDADGFSSLVQYNFDHGARTRVQGPPPAGQSQGLIRTMTYDAAGRPLRVTSTNNGAYQRIVYGSDYILTYATVNNLADEDYSIQYFDGMGRLIDIARNHPGSVGGYRAQTTDYDLMGRVLKQSNPTEVYAWWSTAGDDAAGWLYTQQTYDWQSRPLITTNTDGTTKTASYGGCGCAGGEVVTLTDEGTLDAGTAKRRQQKIYHDVLGRAWKTEVLNWEGGLPYSTTVTSFNMRDQVTQVRQYAGAEGSGTYQDTVITYDGHGRLKTRHTPEQNAGAATSWDYNLDDTIHKVTDARGASQTFSYNNNRHLVSGITYAWPGGGTVPNPVSFGYDAAGNRTSMTDGLGSKSYDYDQLSRLKSETRTFTGIGTFPLTYDYNLADQLKKITYPTNMTINYGYDTAARLSGVTGSDNLYFGVSQYASGFAYRAWGGLKQMTDGTNHTSSFGYNSRLQANHFEISGGVVSQNYDYYNDGRIKFVDNLSDANFDCSYFYDHAARLTLAASGGAANQAPGDVPYWETFAYEGFGHTSSRYTESWSQDEFSDFASYQNERRNGWGYDADGRLKTIETRQYNYDAAGRQELMTGQVWGGSGYGYYPTSTASGFDGDGNRVKEVSSGIIFTSTTHYLRSSVLGGAIVQEIKSAGQTIGYVYTPGGQLLTRQMGSPVWKHLTPAGTSQFEIGQDGFARKEFDPVGADVALTAPPPHNGGGGDGDLRGNNGSPADSRFSDLANPAAGCVVGWLEMPCSWVTRGSLSWLDVSYAAAQKQPPGGNPFGRWVRDKKYTDHPGTVPSSTDVDDNGYPIEVATATLTTGRQWEFFSLSFNLAMASGALPQNPDREGIKNLVNATLAIDPCAQFAERILNAVSSKKNPALGGGDLFSIFALFLNKGGQYTRTLPPGSAGWGNPIGLIPKGAKIAMSSFPNPALQTWSDAVYVIDELFHLAGSKGQYDDYQLATAAHGIPEYASQMSLSPQKNVFHPTYSAGNASDRYDGGYSSYFHNIARTLCSVAKP